MRYIFILFLLSLLVAGCSSNTSNPITPAAQSDSSIPLIGASLYEDGGFNALGMLGLYELEIDSISNTAELVSKRTSAIGESYTVSGIGFFTVAPCADCLKLAGLYMTPDGNVAITFSISHPFNAGDPLKPPSAVNRLDLDVFDLAMVIAPQETIPATYSLTGISACVDICAEPDGYTTELANVTEDNAAMPYFLVVDESGEASHTWNEFHMGVEDVEFDAIFNLAAGGNFRFDLYLTMGYGFSAVKADRLNPAYYNPEFNRKAAWKVDVTPPEGDDPPVMGNTWDDNDNTTPYNITVEVFDWQIGANVDAELTNPTDIYAASGVSSVSAEIPGMNSSLQSVTTADSGTGMPDAPLVYTLSIANENLLSEGEYIGLVKVTDERAVGTIGDRDFLIDAPDGVTLEHYEMPEYATYQTFTATVVAGIIPLEGWLCFGHDPQHTGMADCVLDPATLEHKWTFSTGAITRSSPVIANEIAYFGSDNSNVHAVDIATGVEVWHVTLDSAVTGTAVIGEDAIYIGTYGGFMYSLSKTDGSEVWTAPYQVTYTPVGPDKYMINGAILVDGRIYFCANNGMVYGINQSDGSEIFTAPTFEPSLGNSCKTTPAYYVDEDQILVTSASADIVCYDAFDGTELWRESAGDMISCSPTLQDGKAYFTCRISAWKYDITSNPPTLLWSEQLLNPDPFFVNASGAVDDTHYYSLGDSQGKVYACDKNTGSFDWIAPSFFVHGFVASPAISGDTIYCAADNNYLYGLNTTTGAVEFTYDLGAYVDRSSVAIAYDRLLVGCSNGNMYCFGQ